MSAPLPRRPSRRLSRSLAGAVVAAICAAGVWLWLGHQLPTADRADGFDAFFTLASLRDVFFPVASMSAHARPETSGQASATSGQAAAATPPRKPAVLPEPGGAEVALAPPLRAPPQAATDPRPAPAAALAVPAPAEAPSVRPPAPIAPAFDIVRVAPTGEAVLAGRAAPGAHVTISDDGQAIALATADNEGQWVALPTARLPAGGQILTLTATLIATEATSRPGTVPRGPVAGAAPLLVVVPARQMTSDPPATSQTAVAVLTPPDTAPRVLQGLPVPKSDRAGPARLGLDVVDYDQYGAIRFAGSAPPGATIRAYIDNQTAGDATADADGYWSFSPDTEVVPGDHRLRVDQLADARVTARVEVPFERTAATDIDLREGRVIVQPRETLWRIARRTYGQGIRYTVIFQANRDQIRDPDRIFPGQVFDLPAAERTPEAADAR